MAGPGGYLSGKSPKDMPRWLPVEKFNQPALDVQYVDYAAWQRDSTARESDGMICWPTGERRWQTSLRCWNCPGITRARQYKRSRDKLSILKSLLSVFSRLQQLSYECGITVFMSLTAAFQVLLHRYSGMTDICVGTPIANRNHTALEKLAGFFANTLVLRAKFEEGISFRDLLDQVKSFCAGGVCPSGIAF